ncbi:hypothetical protein KIW84_076731 [Lathyrus oleraceus]|uniref:Uncharacterized protein n=1 Tax=Pisum sativum TaxID=3888 RepID=A0A9D4VXB4_PEA|nr:hypothetical protein KIW84_076731 [Pisum sativum]
MKDPSRRFNRNPYLPSHHEKWKRERQRHGCDFTSEATHEVAKKIDLLVEKSKDGIFVPQGRHNILVEAIGTEEYGGCVHGLGRGVDLRLYFGPSQTSKEVNCKK